MQASSPLLFGLFRLLRSCKRNFNYENFQLVEISVFIASSSGVCSLGGVGMGCVGLTGPWEEGRKETGAREVMMIRPAHTGREVDRPGYLWPTAKVFHTANRAEWGGREKLKRCQTGARSFEKICPRLREEKGRFSVPETGLKGMRLVDKHYSPECLEQRPWEPRRNGGGDKSQLGQGQSLYPLSGLLLVLGRNRPF